MINLKNPEDETARLQRLTGIPWRGNALRHSFCSYRVAIAGDMPLVSIESGNSLQMIKRCYWDVKHFDEGLRWFGLTLPITCGAPTGTILDAAYVLWQRLISQTQISRSAMETAHVLQAVHLVQALVR